MELPLAVFVQCFFVKQIHIIRFTSPLFQDQALHSRSRALSRVEVLTNSVRYFLAL